MNITKSFRYLAAKCILVLTLFTGLATAVENERHIHINGEHLDLSNIQLLDQIVGSTVGNGYYWLNMQTGQWGFKGNNQTQGVIASIANQTSTPNQQAAQQAEQQNSSRQQANRYNEWEGVDHSNNSSVVSGTVDGKTCTYVSVEGMTMRSCD